MKLKAETSYCFHSKVELTKSFNLGASCALCKVVYKGPNIKEEISGGLLPAKIKLCFLLNATNFLSYKNNIKHT